MTRSEGPTGTGFGRWAPRIEAAALLLLVVALTVQVLGRHDAIGAPPTGDRGPSKADAPAPSPIVTAPPAARPTDPVQQRRAAATDDPDPAEIFWRGRVLDWRGRPTRARVRVEGLENAIEVDDSGLLTFVLPYDFEQPLVRATAPRDQTGETRLASPDDFEIRLGPPALELVVDVDAELALLLEQHDATLDLHARFLKPPLGSGGIETITSFEAARTTTQKVLVPASVMLDGDFAAVQWLPSGLYHVTPLAHMLLGPTDERWVSTYSAKVATTLFGRVIDEQGEPVAGLEMKAEIEGVRDAWLGATTRPDGTFFIPLPSPCRGTIRPRSYAGTPLRWESGRFEELAFFAARRVRVRVEDQNGDPIERYWIRSIGARSRTGPDGGFDVANELEPAAIRSDGTADLSPVAVPEGQSYWLTIPGVGETLVATEERITDTWVVRIDAEHVARSQAALAITGLAEGESVMLLGALRYALSPRLQPMPRTWTAHFLAPGTYRYSVRGADGRARTDPVEIVLEAGATVEVDVEAK
jgi:hypothetical protein